MLLQVHTYISLVKYTSPTLNHFLPSSEGDEPRKFLVAFLGGGYIVWSANPAAWGIGDALVTKAINNSCKICYD